MKWLGVVFVLSLFAYEYAPVLNAPFVYEDARWIESGDKTIRFHELSRKNVPRLMSRLSWRWQEGQSMAAFHTLNIGLHIAVAVLVGVLLGELASSFSAGAVASAVFLLHPMNMEAVGYLSGRSELIAAIGVLVACICGIKRQWVGVLAGLGFGVLGKETAIIGIPLVGLVCAMREEWSARSLAVTAALVSAVMGAVWLLAPQDGFLTPTWVGLQMAAWLRNAVQSVIPVGASVDFNYRALPVFALWIAVAFIAGVLEIAWRKRVAAPLLALGLAWMACSILPRFVTVTTYSILNEHQFYTARIGIAFIAAHYWTLDRCPA